jgi:hypothetical protein
VASWLRPGDVVQGAIRGRWRGVRRRGGELVGVLIVVQPFLIQGACGWVRCARGTQLCFPLTETLKHELREANVRIGRHVCLRVAVDGRLTAAATGRAQPGPEVVPVSRACPECSAAILTAGWIYCSPRCRARGVARKVRAAGTPVAAAPADT